MSPAWKAALPLLAFLVAVSPAAAGPPKPGAEQVARWIDQLGSDDFAVREEASRHLWAAGQAAEDALTRAARSPDVEVRRRVNDLLDKFRWGIYPDTPDDVVALIGRYQSGDLNAKQAALSGLFDRGSAGCAAVAKILTAEPSEDVRRNLLLNVAQETPRAFGPLLEADDFATLEKLLEATLAVPLNESAVQNYAAYCLLRGRLDDAVRRFRDRPGLDAAYTRTILAYLYRARGDLPAARAAAEKSGRQDLVEQVLVDQGDWKELAKRADARAANADLRAAGFRLAYHRLAGDADGVNRLAAELRAQVGTQAEDAAPWLLARVLFLNGKPDDALAVLKGHRARTVFDILAARLQLRDALALPTRLPPNDADGQMAFDVDRARILYLVGERAQARATFDRLGGKVERANGGKAYQLLVRTEARLGFKEQALEHCARLLTTPPLESPAPEMLGALFPGQGDRAWVWWQFLRNRAPAEAPAETLKRVRDVVEGKTAGKELETLAAEAARAAPRGEEPLRGPWLIAVAEACQAAGLDAAARGHFEQAAEGGAAPALLRLGDFLAGKKRWREAAAAYERAWRKDHRSPLALYLQGRALARLGDPRGPRLVELAHWVPLGDEAVRQAFAAELRRRGEHDDARRERQLLLAVSAPFSFAAGEALRDASVDALDRKDYLRAAEDQERAMLRLLEPDTEFVEYAAYATVPAFIRRVRALGLAAAGRADDAVREAEAALDLLPGNGELTTRLVPALDRIGRRKEADALFARALAVQQRLCADYPRGAWLHNNLAWTAARCGRELDAALEHARRAVELDPETIGYVDTLAEVHFQRGDRERAVELMKQCVARDAGNSYYRKQLRRFEAGDRSAEVPDGDG